jgi:hypothetical protein
MEWGEQSAHCKWKLHPITGRDDLLGRIEV